jgi:hypothetical protein
MGYLMSALGRAWCLAFIVPEFQESVIKCFNLWLKPRDNWLSVKCYVQRIPWIGCRRGLLLYLSQAESQVVMWTYTKPEDDILCYVLLSVIIHHIFLGAFAKSWRATIGSVMSVFLCVSVRPHATTKLPLERFSWILLFEYFSNSGSKRLKFY